MRVNCSFCSALVTEGMTDKKTILCPECYQTVIGDAPKLEQIGGWKSLSDTDACINCGTLLTWSATLNQTSSWSGDDQGAIIVCDGCVEEFTTTIKDAAVRRLQEMIGK